MMFLVQALFDGVLLGIIYAIMSLGLSLTLDVMGIVNVAHSTFIMLGSFLAFELLRTFGIDPALSMIIALPVFFVLGALVERLLIRRVARSGQIQGLLVLFGLMVAIESIAVLVWTTDSRVLTVGYTNMHVTFGDITLADAKIVAAGLSLVLIAAVYLFLHKTLIGKAIRAMAQNRDAAVMLGIDVGLMAMIVFGLGTATAAAGGVALAMNFPFDPTTHIQYLAWAFLVVIVGGLGGVGNTLLGGLVIGVLQTLCTALLPFKYVYLVLYSALALALILRGRGLGGSAQRSL